MQQASNTKHFLLPVKTIIVLVLFVSLVGIVTSGFKEGNGTTNKHSYEVAEADSVASVQAFMTVYEVLMSPRCMNCHPSGDIPLQGDDSHLHTMYPLRGQDGKGLYAMKCNNCHQPQNVPGIHTPPGNPEWHLPPADMKMVFEGRTPHDLARQLMDPSQNGHKTIPQLIEHADDGLVKAGWNPGEGRTLPPISHAEFKKAWITWIEKGGFAPEQ